MTRKHDRAFVLLGAHAVREQIVASCRGRRVACVVARFGAAAATTAAMPGYIVAPAQLRDALSKSITGEARRTSP